ncbi:DUF6838 family protein [Paenibacillus puldeungensis]|uniref:DUF6838 family protein n=1 Tax=Paenibacillus puldeungensis TaxID=696536 RepID=A0ABW3S340_9BACL
MPEVTVNSIRDGVILALSNFFPTMDIFGEYIEQDFNAPCFYVKLLTTSHDHELDRRYKRSNSFDVHFFPAGADYNREAHSMAENLYVALAKVNIDGAIYKGTKMNHEIVDNVLHFFVDFNFLVSTPKNEIKMQTLKQEGNVKNG